MASCNHDCKNCKSKCEHDTTNLIVKTNEANKIKHIIGVVSGKGGVGKSATTSLLAETFNKLGYKVGILDADITGPSIPQAFGVHGGVEGSGNIMYPRESVDGIKIISLNLLIKNEKDPVVWRGPIIAGAVKQFYQDVLWGELDYLFVDMPPGTGDVALTVFQSLPVDGVVIVSTPQDLVSMIVAKACKMAEMMKIKVIGLVENMSYMKCSCCGNILEPFGPSKLEIVAKENNIKPLAKLPIDPDLAKFVDNGDMANCPLPDLNLLVDEILKLKK